MSALLERRNAVHYAAALAVVGLAYYGAGPRGAAAAILVVCSITVWNTAENDGPFVRDSITESLLTTQLFIAVAALTSLLLAAVTAERTRASAALAASEASQRALADEQAALRRVATLVAGAPPPSRVFE